MRRDGIVHLHELEKFRGKDHVGILSYINM
jgi:hypothetical protein